MSSTSAPNRSKIEEIQQAPFLVGVTGHRDLDPKLILELKRRLENVFNYLLWGDRRMGGCHFQNLINDLATTQDEHTFYRNVLRNWPGFKKSNTPIVVLSSLATGADMIVAEVALETGCLVRAVLPFEESRYKASSAFDPPPGYPGGPHPKEDPEGYQSWAAKWRKVEINKFEPLIARIREQSFPGHQPVTVIHIARDFDDSQAYTWDQRVKFEKLGEKEIDQRDRRERYAAAGEYMALHTHVLIAIWDTDSDPLGKGGTGDAIQSRLFGSTPDLLWASTPLSIPNAGPALLIRTIRLIRSQAGASSSSRTTEFTGATGSIQPVQRPAIQFLHPYVTSPQQSVQRFNHPTLDGDRSWQFQQCDTLLRVMSNLAGFNDVLRTKPVTDGSVLRELNTRLNLNKEASENITRHTLGAQDPARLDMFDELHQIAAVRRRASNAAQTLENYSKGTLAAIFLLMFLAVAALHLFSHWHVHLSADAGNTSAPTAHTAEVHATQSLLSNEPAAVQPIFAGSKSAKLIGPVVDRGIDESSVTSGSSANVAGDAAHEASKDPTRIYFGLASALFAMSSLGVFFWAKMYALDDRGHDCRAIGEALRVQFYWNLCGVGRSVPANYLQRQRSELDWIRGAVRAVAAPYESWAEWFRTLSRSKQLEFLEITRETWVFEQWAYFEKSMFKNEHKLHFYHDVGKWLGCSGFFVLLQTLACCYWPEFHKTLHGWAVGPEYYLVIASIIGLVIWPLMSWLLGWGSHHGHSRTHSYRPVMGTMLSGESALHPEHRKNYQVKSSRDYRTISQRWLNLQLPNPWEHIPPSRSHIARAIRTVAVFLLRVPAILGLSSLIMILEARLPAFHHFPNAENFGIILAGVSLLLGAMSVAWAEKRLYSEHSYQYSTMLHLFHHAYLRLSHSLEDLRADLNARLPAFRPDLGAIAPDGCAANQVNEFQDFDDGIHSLQVLMFELGKEALDENAEWLILHRARPLEPVMPG